MGMVKLSSKITKNINGDNSKKRNLMDKFQKISVKLTIGLVIPVVLLILYAVLSYTISERTITHNYEKSISNNLSAVSDYISLKLDYVEQKSLEMALDPNINEVYGAGNSEDAIKDGKVILSNMLSSVSSVNAFMSVIHIIGSNEEVISTRETQATDIYKTFMESETAKEFTDKKLLSKWVGVHSNLDEKFSFSYDVYNTNNYGLSLVTKLKNQDAFIVIDISKEQISNIFSNNNIGKGTILGFIVDGKETLIGTEEDSVFSGLKSFQNSLTSDDFNDYNYLKYRGEDYLFIYSKSKTMDGVVCALVPKADIIGKVGTLGSITTVFVIIALLCSVFTLIMIAGGITKAIGKLRKSVLQASTGDLTVKFDTNRKDEFRTLSNGIEDMMFSMRKLIGEVQEVGKKVSSSAGELTETSSHLLDATKDISQTIDNIEQGIVQQASDTEGCLTQMNTLSEDVNNVSQVTSEIDKIADNTKIIAAKGIKIVDELSNKAKATSDITNTVISGIRDFELQSKNIGDFIHIINDIASQTNLLSLNASIEAARAGEAGKGFAVVAVEIRKLADQSVDAAKKIQNIVLEIQTNITHTVNITENAKNIVDSQTEALSKTVEVFNEINQHVTNLASNLNHITDGVKNIENAKKDTLLAVESISAISEESAAATEEVAATALNQIDVVAKLNLSAIELESDANKLEESIKMFRIE